MPAVEPSVSIVPRPTERNLRSYLESRLGRPLRIAAVEPLGDANPDAVKAFGYGTPLRIDYERAGVRGSVVLETIAPGAFGHDEMPDRAQILLWSHRAFNRLPQHVRSLDVGGFRASGELVSVADLEEFFVLNEYAEGTGYFCDLERLRDGANLRELDVARADALCEYLASIHRVAGSKPELYRRRLRELVGGSECIAGILDSYPEHVDAIDAGVLQAIDRACLDWRWRLKPRSHRLRQVHGDFHPWNVLFRDGVDFTVLDRSRGEWGDPADDVACLTINYLFFSLLRSGALEGAFQVLFERFWRRYVDLTGDGELVRVVAPFFAFRGLVLASPVWYPHLTPEVRRKVLAFVRAVLGEREFDPARVNEYCGG